MARGNKIAIFTLFLTFFGLLSVYNASSAAALRDFNDQYHFLREQSKWVFVGVGLMFLVSRVDYRRYFPLAILILLFSIFSLFAVFIPGIGVHAYGATRWINLGFTTLQPAELAKLAIIIYLSAWFAYKEKGRLLAFFLLVGLVLSLTMLQPDMGTTIIIAGICLGQYFFSQAPLWHLLALVPVGIFTAVLAVVFAPYRMQRLFSFLDINHDPEGASYHIRQALIAIGSGGFWGLGIGNSRQKFSYLPEATTDSIFAIIAEEFGFLGSVLLLATFANLYYLCFSVALSAKDNFGKLLGTGISCWLSIQTVINIGAMLALFPLTGVPLPFISYGGTALVCELIGIGIIMSVDRINNKG